MKNFKYFLAILFSFQIFNLSAQVYVDGGGSNTPPYNSWATAATNLQTGIDYASTNTIAQVWVAAGTYTNGSSFKLKNNVGVYGGFATGSVGFASRNPTVNISILSGANVRRVIYHNNDGTNATAILDGVTIQQGAGSNGGGAYLNTVSPTFTDCIFQGNTSTGTRDGGGVFIQNASTSVFTNCTFANNVATDDGGAVHIQNTGCNPVFDNCTFSSNQCNDEGGAIRIGSGNPAFNTCTFNNNTANDRGGAVVVANGAPTFVGCTMNANTSTNFAGAVYIFNGTPSFHRSLFSGNSTGIKGGAFYINAGVSSIYTSILSGNSTMGNGGAIFTNTSSGNYFNNTIYGNSAANGGGLSTNSNDDPTFHSTIFWGNTATTAGNEIYLQDTGSDPYFKYCCIQGGTAAFAGAGSGGSYAGARFSNSITTDPLFVNAGGNDFHLTLGTSPCIGTGDPTTSGFSFPTDEDMDLQKRVRGIVDMGAYETNNPPTIVTVASVDNPGPVAVTMDEDGAPTAWALTLYVIDPDNENITWTILTPATNGVASPATGTSTGTFPGPAAEVINYVPTANYYGTDMFVVQVTDGVFTDQIQVDVTINSISDPPSFTSTPVITGKALQVYTYNIVATDPDLPAEVLTITCPTKPAWLTFTDFGNRTAQLTGTPTDLDVGTFNIVLEVSDGVNPLVQQVYTLTIADRILNVPLEYATIQLAVDAAVTGDKVVVASGTYVENVLVDNKDIEISGNPSSPATVTVQGDGTDAVFTFQNGGTTILDGFTITNGGGHSGIPSVFTLHAPTSGRYGGGIFCYQSNPTLNNLIITGNTLLRSGNYGGSGAAIYIGNVSTVTIGGANTLISGNTSEIYRGGGICIDDSDVTIKGAGGGGSKVVIDSNVAGNYGGGVAAYNSILNLKDVKIINNSTLGVNGRGGGVYLHSTVMNNNGGVTISGNSANVSGNNTQVSP